MKAQNGASSRTRKSCPRSSPPGASASPTATRDRRWNQICAASAGASGTSGSATAGGSSTPRLAATDAGMNATRANSGSRAQADRYWPVCRTLTVTAAPATANTWSPGNRNALSVPPAATEYGPPAATLGPPNVTADPPVGTTAVNQPHSAPPGFAPADATTVATVPTAILAEEATGQTACHVQVGVPPE